MLCRFPITLVAFSAACAVQTSSIAPNATNALPSTSASSAAHTSGTATTPTKAPRVDLAVRKASYFLGENVLVDFCLVNGSDVPITIKVGGDYRGSSRSPRFKLDVRDASGNAMPDPDPNPMNFGGMGYEPEIAPGDKWCQSLALMRYARIDSPGTYTITATHDLGWPKGTAPTGTTKITFAMPSPAQAEAVVVEMEKLPVDPNGSAGKINVPYQDFSAMRYDVYTAPLASRARAGKKFALDGLTEIPTTNATRELVSLLATTSPTDFAHAVAMSLAMRLPDPALNGQLGARNPFENGMTEQRKYLSSHAWDPAFTDDVRTAARARLASTEVDDQRDGAFMLEALGTSADGASLSKALDAAIERTRTVQAETDLYPVPRGACQELLRAAEMLVVRGYAAPQKPSSPGEIAMWLVALSHATTLPNGWENEIARELKHQMTYVRELALDHVPANHLTPSISQLVVTNLGSVDGDVVVAAAKLAEREHAVALASNVVAAMKSQTGMRLNIVSYAAHQLGARYTRAKALVARLSTPAAFDEALGELVDLLDYQGRSSNGVPTDAQRAVVVAKWKPFVEAHRADIEADKKVALDDPSVSPALVPPTWKLGRGNGVEWP